jgi:NADH:ubiquinone reductase (H+-translocating)
VETAKDYSRSSSDGRDKTPSPKQKRSAMENIGQESAKRASLQGHPEHRSDAKKVAYRGISTDGLHFRQRSSEHLPPLRQVFPTRIVIVGGGFAGVAMAEHLERKFGADPSVELTLVSDSNALLFTPMLAQVAASSVEPTHISTPLRASLRRTNVVRGHVTGLDVERRAVLLAPDAGLPESATMPASATTVPYDHLVLALGSVSNYRGMDNVEAEAFDFGTLTDAIRIRNHVIDAFERADREANPATRQALLTVVVAGGSFSGASLAGMLNDFLRGILDEYPNIPAEEVRVILLHSRERILPELSEPLAAYALEGMKERGVQFKLNTRVADARPGVVVLDTGEEIRAETLIWTAGTTPNPLLEDLPVERDGHGAVVVDDHLAVPGRDGLWAAGDCAAATDAKTGEPCPPTAQFALREARTVAENIYASVRGRPFEPFSFDPLVKLSVLGQHAAVAEIKGLRFYGLLAWLVWGAFYLPKLPGLERKARVLLDWVIELFFPRDIAQTVDFGYHNNDADADGTAEATTPAPEARWRAG